MPRKKKEELVEDVTELKKTTRRRKKEPIEVKIDEEEKIITQEEKEKMLWLDLRTAMKGKKILTARLEGIEKTASGIPIAVAYYNGVRIVIPASEMLIDINEYEDQTKLELHNRYSQILSRTMGAEIDFIVSGIRINKKSKTVVASRKAAMLKKRQKYYLTEFEGKPRITEGKRVEARVIGVGDKTIRVEAFGVETTITAKNAEWEWVDDLREYYQIGDRVFVKILGIEINDIENIKIIASIREAKENPAKENIKKCVLQGKYIGKVTGIEENIIFVRLNIGVNAIATYALDKRTPTRKDEVSFIVTKIDEERGIAIGIISKILKTFI